MATLKRKAMTKAYVAMAVGLLAASGPVAIGLLHLDYGIDYRYLSLPIAVLSVAAMIVFAVYTTRVRRLAKSAACPWCGYDTHGLDHCPECGRDTACPQCGYNTKGVDRCPECGHDVSGK